jgi:probable phosphoglycerate mutase
MSQAGLYTQLYLVRHGETDWNAEGRLQGCIDRSLNSTGIAQAKEIGAQFSSLQLGAIYSSHLTRAKETARIIAEHHTCPLFEDRALRENELGFLEGMLKEEYLKQFEEKLAHLRALPREERLQHKLGPDIESIADTGGRAIPCLHQIARKHPNQTVVVVTHGGVIRAVMMLLSHHHEVVVGNIGYLHVQGDGHNINFIGHKGIQV